MLTFYFLAATAWCVFVFVHQGRRYQRKRPHFMDTLVEHFLLFPIGIALYVGAGLLAVRVDREKTSSGRSFQKRN